MVRARYASGTLRGIAKRIALWANRTAAAALISSVLAEYGLFWEPTAADRDFLEVENFYLATGGDFWAIEKQGQLVGTAAYYPSQRGENAVEIRKMYLLPDARGQGLGNYVIKQLEEVIARRGFA